MELNLSNISQAIIEIKKEHGFEMCFELDEEVVDGLQMADAYTCKVKLWQENEQNLKTFDVTVLDNNVTVTSTTVTGLDYGDYFFIIQPTTPTITNYITIQGDFIVE